MFIYKSIYIKNIKIEIKIIKIEIKTIKIEIKIAKTNFIIFTITYYKMSCFVCCEKFNKTIHEKVICGFDDCNYECCKSCIRTYLLSTTNDPHCMNCKRGYSQQFIITNLNRSFNDKTFKKHRKTLLVDRELSRMPETMLAAANYKQIEEHEKNVKIYTDKIKELNQEVKILRERQKIEYNIIRELKTGKTKSEEKRKFIHPCPNDDCHGYLSTQYKCELCKLYTCPKCHELIGHNKDDPHTCDPNNVSSAEEIKKTSKPCPNCGIRIQKASGCDQMWCTECQVAFSWNTGKIDVTGAIHNPHYYQHMAKENNGQVPRNPRDVICGGLINYYQFGGIKRKLGKDNKILDTQLSDLHRLTNHISNYDLPRIRAKVRELSDNQQLRILYILNRKTKEELATQIYRNDTMRKKFMDILNIYELLSVVGIENFTNIYNAMQKVTLQEFIKIVTNFIENYQKLIEYTNNELKIISITYNHSVIVINNTFNWINYKYTMKESPKKTNSSAGAGCSTDPL